MNMIPSDPEIPLRFQTRQFSVTLCFVITINKSQEQSLSYVWLFLSKPIFTHRQFYVDVSRVKSKGGLKILVLDDNGNLCNRTRNVVYQEIFHKI